MRLSLALAAALVSVPPPLFADEDVLSAIAASGASVVILGEVHDNPHHHRLQVEALDVLDPTAIVFEMLTPDEVTLVTPDLAADPSALAAALDWDNSGWPDFAFYAPLLAYGTSVPIYGAEVTREDAQRAFAEGAAAAFGTGAERFGLDRPLPEDEQAAREADQMAAHCDALPEEILPGFVAAQRLRDAVLSETALRALDETGGPVAVITGNGHARTDRGVPALIALAAPGVTVLSLGQIEDADGADQASLPYDLVTSAPPPEDRPDPCAAFR
ncbi:hypothetical protein HKCCE3408_01715 [Rhodobacterales bacterium HKCCE3408]|nr:hypothetical protein [Rhodobacterales bacterium HKCCE3408]